MNGKFICFEKVHFKILILQKKLCFTLAVEQNAFFYIPCSFIFNPFVISTNEYSYKIV